MERHIQPNPGIIHALSSEGEHATPFSRIPGFIKKYVIRKNQETKLISILSSVGEKELSYLDTKVEKIKNPHVAENSDMYQTIIQIESGKDKQGTSIKTKLEKLAKQIIASEMGSPIYQILKEINVDRDNGSIESSTFDNHHTDISEQLPDGDKEFVHQEQQVRVIMNALIMGAGHRIFDKLESDPKYSQSINKINPNLYQSYYDMVYTNLKHMWESIPNGVGVNTGSMELLPTEDGTKINIKADMFPVLLHEMAKGVIEYMAYTRYNNLSPEIIQSILSVDSRESEHRMMLIGPQIYKQLFFLIKESIAQYNETKGVLAQKQESDYIMPVFSRLVQLPATDFLAFMEMILRQDQSGEVSMAFIKNIIQDIDNQYLLYLQTRPSQQIALTISDIVKQLVRELEIDQSCQNFIQASVFRCKDILESDGFVLSDKKIARKLAEYYPQYVQKYGSFDHSVDDAFFAELQDTIHSFISSRIEQLAFGSIHEQQKKFPKRTKNHEGKSINIHPRFPLSALEEAKSKVSGEQIDTIRNKVVDILQKGSLQDRFKDHDEMSTTNSLSTERFITLDSTVPECIMEWENNRGLYQLTTLEQLKRESGAMGGHCVADYINAVSKGQMIIYSLRLGTESRWTIGYIPSNDEINQVKGYTNNVKNATITQADPDYSQLLEALIYLTKTNVVKRINDVSAFYANRYLLTNKGLLSSDEFVDIVKQDSDSICVYQSAGDVFVEEDIDEETIRKISTFSVSLVFVKEGEYMIHYNPSNKRLISMPIKDSSPISDESVLQKLKLLSTQFDISSIQGKDALFYKLGFLLTNRGLLSSDQFIQLIENQGTDNLVVFQGHDVYIPESVSPEALKKLSKFPNLILHFLIKDIDLYYTNATSILEASFIKDSSNHSSNTDESIYFKQGDSLYTKLQEIIKIIEVIQIKGISTLDSSEYLYTNMGLISRKAFASLCEKHGNELFILNPNSVLEVPLSVMPGGSPNITTVRFKQGSWVITWRNTTDETTQHIESIRNEKKIPYSSYADEHADRKLHNDNNRNKDYGPIISFLNTVIKKLPGYTIKDLDHLYEAGTLIRTIQGFYSPQEFIDLVDSQDLDLSRRDATIALPENISMDIVDKLLAKYPEMNYLFTIDGFVVKYQKAHIASLLSSNQKETLGFVYKSDQAKKVLKYLFNNLPVSSIFRDNYFIKTESGWFEPDELIASSEQENIVILKSNWNAFYFDISTDPAVLKNLLTYATIFHFLLPGIEDVLLDYKVQDKTIYFMQHGDSASLTKDHPHYETILTAIVTISRKIPVLAVSNLSRDMQERGLMVTNSGIITEKEYLQLLEDNIHGNFRTKYSENYDGSRVPDIQKLHINTRFSSPKITPSSTTSEDVINYLTNIPGIELDLTAISQDIKNKIFGIQGSLIDLSNVIDYPQLRGIYGSCNVTHATILRLKSLRTISQGFFHMPWDYIKELDLSSLEQTDERQRYKSHKTTKDLKMTKIQSYDIPLLSDSENHIVEKITVGSDVDLPF